MPLKIINQLIKGEYKFSGQAVHVPVKSVCIDRGLAKNSLDLLEGAGLKGKALVVSDTNTHLAMAGQIEQSLGSAAKSLIFPAGVKADIENVEKINFAADSMDYILAVGSGTINDLCKYASFLVSKPYAVFGTAPSMNGYGSANASITMYGHKKTLKAHLPRGIFLDLDVLIKAPLRLIRSGLGDSICRPTAQSDWLLSNILLGTYYTDLPFLLLRGVEEELFSNSSSLIRGDVETMRLLAATLVLSGFGMYIAGGSYPASQGEHMLAHSMEMLYGDFVSKSYHGEQIAVTTLAMAALQEKILGKGGVQLKVSNFPCSIPNLLPETLKECADEYAVKQFSAGICDEMNHFLALNWEDIRVKILAVTMSYNTIYSVLEKTGCPLKSQNIGLQSSQYNNALRYAKFMRSRFTFLDL